MEDIKNRLEIIKRIKAGEITLGVDYFNYELYSVHFRKILELIAFGSLTANRDKYSRAHEDFRKEWNARNLLKNLFKINPDFYPKPFYFGVPKDPTVNHHFEFHSSGFLTRDNFITLYDTTNKLLHSRNPFDNPLKPIELNVHKWITHIQKLLRYHQIRLVDRPEFWIIDMEYPPSGHVMAMIASPLP